MTEICLRVKQLGLDSIPDTLSRAIQPPAALAVERAITVLCRIGALDSKHELTDLGLHLVELPVHPRIGKMLLYSVAFQCLTPVLTISCALCMPDVFSLRMNGRDHVDVVKKHFSASSNSDMIMLARVFQSWQESKRSRNSMFCETNSVSARSMSWIKSVPQLSGCCGRLV